jgi:hypothetical protein
MLQSMLVRIGMWTVKVSLVHPLSSLLQPSYHPPARQLSPKLLYFQLSYLSILRTCSGAVRNPGRLARHPQRKTGPDCLVHLRELTVRF